MAPITIDPRTFTFDPGYTAATDAVVTGSTSESNAVTPPGPRLTPFSIPRDEAYFWSAHWQQAEREADADIAEGRTRRFRNSREAIRWLFSEAD